MTSQKSFHGPISGTARYDPSDRGEKSLKNLPSRYDPSDRGSPFFAFHGTTHRTLIEFYHTPAQQKGRKR
jgi:hypothetical protein